MTRPRAPASCSVETLSAPQEGVKRSKETGGRLPAMSRNCTHTTVMLAEEPGRSPTPYPKRVIQGTLWRREPLHARAPDLVISIFSVQLENGGAEGFGKYTNEELSNQQELPFVSANWQAENVILLVSKIWTDQIH